MTESVKSKSKPILCLDFDGVIHSYSSGWKGATVTPDPPVPGALQFIVAALEHFQVAIYSSRSAQAGGISAMRAYLYVNFHEYWIARVSQIDIDNWLSELQWPTSKPSAFLTIDDRALTFDGTWPDPRYLLNFKPWNKRDKDTGDDPRDEREKPRESELFELPDGTAICCNPGGRFHGWLFARHPDGQYVSVRKLELAKHSGIFP